MFVGLFGFGWTEPKKSTSHNMWTIYSSLDTRWIPKLLWFIAFETSLNTQNAAYENILMFQSVLQCATLHHCYTGVLCGAVGLFMSILYSYQTKTLCCSQKRHTRWWVNDSLYDFKELGKKNTPCWRINILLGLLTSRRWRLFFLMDGGCQHHFWIKANIAEDVRWR